MERQIIGLSGYARSGKDSVAAFLTRHDFQRMSMADKIRGVLYELNPAIGVMKRTGDVIRLQELVDNVGWEKAKESEEVRNLLSRMGDQAGRKVLSADVWVDAVFENIKASDHERIVITDVRFPNDAAAVKAAGGKVWRISRPLFGPALGPDDKPLSTEIALDDWVFDMTLQNDGSLKDLRDKTNTIIETFYKRG